jgi:outer membrane protein
LLPSLDASGGFSRSQNWRNTQGGTVVVGGIPITYPPGNTFSASNNWSAGISSRVTLFNGFANTSNINRARASESASRLNLSRTEQSTIYTTHQLYLNVVRSWQLLKVSEENLKRSQRQLERITESNKVGAVALADVYRQQVQAGTDELSLIQAQSNFEKSKADLVAFLGVDDGIDYTVDMAGIPDKIDTAEFAPMNARYADYEELVKTGLQNRPDYLASQESYNGADASVTIARAGHLPTVSASGSYGYNAEEFSGLSDNRGLNLSLNVSLPLFSGFSTQNQVEQAQVSRRNADENLRQAKRQLAVDIRKALLDLESSEKQVMVTQTSVQSAEMDRKIAEEKYNLGAGTLLDLLIANANYTNALSNKVNAVIGYLLSKKQVEFALGTISN